MHLENARERALLTRDFLVNTCLLSFQAIFSSSIVSRDQSFFFSGPELTYTSGMSRKFIAFSLPVSLFLNWLPEDFYLHLYKRSFQGTSVTTGNANVSSEKEFQNMTDFRWIFLHPKSSFPLTNSRKESESA